jgi:hypothetical protein
MSLRVWAIETSTMSSMVTPGYRSLMLARVREPRDGDHLGHTKPNCSRQDARVRKPLLHLGRQRHQPLDINQSSTPFAVGRTVRMLRSKLDAETLLQIVIRFDTVDWVVCSRSAAAMKLPR